ncbi:hypothetical protein Pyn_05948 [Prunus yedoensis var. nudiflora]|uniref:Uncharacterized protein n=1 Tax=Prunus yedoensis var. nudiflora TaxID=2094558 RepID=A0A314XL35_PRUYE|nr:hypothetical protein Pyn_05948 [Prunus yedoensis var. nudiflora]
MKNFVERVGQRKRLREDIDALEIKTKRLKAKLLLAEICNVLHITQSLTGLFGVPFTGGHLCPKAMQLKALIDVLQAKVALLCEAD